MRAARRRSTRSTRLGTWLRLSSSAGAVLDSFHFDAFGNRTSTSATTDPYSGFGGQQGGYRDNETGLTLFTLRYYDSATGRFLTRDPVGTAGGIDVYAYTTNNPTNRIDPLGTTDSAQPPKPNHCAKDYSDCIGHVDYQLKVTLAAITATALIAIAACGILSAGAALVPCLIAADATAAVADAAATAIALDQAKACQEAYNNCIADNS